MLKDIVQGISVGFSLFFGFCLGYVAGILLAAMALMILAMGTLQLLSGGTACG